MKYITFKEANQEKNSIPFCSALLPNNLGNTYPVNIFRVMLSKEEAKNIAKNREVFLILTNTYSAPPEFSFGNPLTIPGASVITNTSFISHTLLYKGLEFNVILERKYNNSKVKARFFKITFKKNSMFYTKDGNIPEKLLSNGKGWLKGLLDSTITELDKSSTKNNNK